MVDIRRRVVDPVPKPFIQLCVFCVFFDRKKTSSFYNGMVCQRDICIKKRYICLFGDNSPAVKDPVPSTCVLVCMTLFGNVYVHVPKRAGDQYQCNERDKDSDSFQCPVAKRILIMQNDIFSIILIPEVNTIYDFIKCLS